MATRKIEKTHLNLTGEFRICSELLKRGMWASPTYGNMKACDVVAMGSNRRLAVIEVKTSQGKNFVTGFYQKYNTFDQEHPTFWVLCSIKNSNGRFQEQFFVRTHQEMAQAQAIRNHHEGLPYEERVRLLSKGVDNVALANIQSHEDKWEKIVQWCSESF